jgi:methionyl aminopeptidase
MIHVKTPNEILVMAQGGKILAEVLSKVLSKVEPGVSELELDNLAEKLIKEKGAEPGFKKVRGYKHTICVSTNDVVVHGVPTGYRLKVGDIIGIDCGVYYKGFNTDMAQTLSVKSQISSRLNRDKSQSEDEIDRFLEIGKRALEEAIKVAKIGNRVGNISKTIQGIVEGAGYSVVRSLVGHGVGRSLHEEPEVPGYLNKRIEKTPFLIEGLTIAVEIIYNVGKKDVVYANNDGWSIKSKDNSLSGLFERTIAITKDGPLVLTQA